MTYPLSNAGRRRRVEVAFTLVELLLVMAIIVVLVAVSAPAFRIPESTKLSSAGTTIIGTFTLARQTAQALNKPIEVRIYNLDSSGSGKQYRALGLFRLDDDGQARPIRKSEWLPDHVMMDSSENARYSKLLDGTEARLKSLSITPEKTDLKYNQDTRCFRFLPDGSTDLERPSEDPANGAKSPNWFVTAHIDTQSGMNIKNWLTVRVDPVNGISTLYQP